MDEMESRIAHLQVAQGRIEEQMKTVCRRLDAQDKLIETVNRLASSVDRLSDGQGRIEGNVTAMRRDVDELRQKPAKAASSLWKTALTALITGIVTYLLGKFTA